MTDRPTPETDAVWGDKSQNILEHARRLERERDAERALADRLAEVLRPLLIATWREKQPSKAELAFAAWKEARSE